MQPDMMQLSYCLSFCKSNFLPFISYQLCPVIIILHIIPFSFTLILFLLIYLIIIFPLLLLIRFPFPCSTFAFLMFSWTELPIKDETKRDCTQISRDPLYEKKGIVRFTTVQLKTLDCFLWFLCKSDTLLAYSKQWRNCLSLTLFESEKRRSLQGFDQVKVSRVPL